MFFFSFSYPVWVCWFFCVWILKYLMIWTVLLITWGTNVKYMLKKFELYIIHVNAVLILILAFLQYLKEQRLPPQTFIPLQSVRVKQVMERLRNLGGTAKLVFDVVQYPFIMLSWERKFHDSLSRLSSYGTVEIK